MNSPRVPRQGRKTKSERFAIYQGLEGLGRGELLLENARKLKDRIELPVFALDYLYERSRSGSPRGAWEDEIRVSMAVNRLISDYFKADDIKRIDPLVDQSVLGDVAERLTSRRGTLVLASHEGFPMLVRSTFNRLFSNGAMIQRSAAGGAMSVQDDTRTALFLTLRALLEGRNAFVAPDGPYGKRTGTISVLGVPCPVADGAPFLAYETRCNTAWLNVLRTEEGFRPVVELGPVRSKDESFDEFRARLFHFYAGKLEEGLTGDPKNISIAHWRKNYRAKIGRPER